MKLQILGRPRDELARNFEAGMPLHLAQVTVRIESRPLESIACTHWGRNEARSRLFGGDEYGS